MQDHDRNPDKVIAQGNDEVGLLANDTAAYFQALSGSAAEEESHLEAAFAQMADEVDFDT